MLISRLALSSSVRMAALALTAAVLIGGTLPACVAVGGSRRVEEPTVGKQLIDLKAALDVGAITESEYAAKKATLLNPPAK